MLAVSQNVYFHIVELFWNKLCAVWKEVIVAQFYTLSRNLAGRAQKKCEELESLLLVPCCRVGLVTGTCSITM